MGLCGEQGAIVDRAMNPPLFAAGDSTALLSPYAHRNLHFQLYGVQ
jgi:hypothetical protein